MHTPRATVAMVAVLALLPASGCSAEPEPTWAEELAARSGSMPGAFAPMTASVSDAMPQVSHPGARAGEESSRVSTALVVGTFTGWEHAGMRPHRHVADSVDEYSGGVVLDLQVDEVVDAAGKEQPDGVVEVLVPEKTGLGLTDAELADRLVDLDRAVVFLGPVRLADREGYVLALDGLLVGEVDRSGAVTWPVLDAVGEQHRERAEQDPSSGVDVALVWGPAAIVEDVATLDELRSLTGPRRAAPQP